LQQEESAEQLEFCYDEFGFRVDKEGKMEPIMCGLADVLGEDSDFTACDL
jgi:hypothetical protein